MTGERVVFLDDDSTMQGSWKTFVESEGINVTHISPNQLCEEILSSLSNLDPKADLVLVGGETDEEDWTSLELGKALQDAGFNVVVTGLVDNFKEVAEAHGLRFFGKQEGLARFVQKLPQYLPTK